jgi:drug/metabolite transporter (DMT)-like permease
MSNNNRASTVIENQRASRFDWLVMKQPLLAAACCFLCLIPLAVILPLYIVEWHHTFATWIAIRVVLIASIAIPSSSFCYLLQWYLLHRQLNKDDEAISLGHLMSLLWYRSLSLLTHQ